MVTQTVYMLASTKKEAKELAAKNYGNRAKYIKPFKYMSRGNNLYEFQIPAKLTYEQSVAFEYLQTHQPVITELQSEFSDLINSDPDFNYSESEFLDWVFDCVLQGISN